MLTIQGGILEPFVVSNVLIARRDMGRRWLKSGYDRMIDIGRLGTFNCAHARR